MEKGKRQVKVKNKIKLTVIIITQNEEEMIRDCLDSVKWADEIVVADNDSIDKTPQIARKCGAKVIYVPAGAKKDFSKLRNEGLKAARGEWVFYLDSDERATPGLKKEILRVISDQRSVSRKEKADHRSSITRRRFTAYAIPRRNFYLGQEVRFGGAWPDYVKRLFKKDKLEKWEGDLHEEPIFEGELGHLKEPMIHLTHRDLSSMVEKTQEWSKVEAELLDKAGHPPVVWWRIFRMMVTKFFERMIKQSAWRDGTVGWINAIFETFNTFIIYAQLWEKQNRNEFART